MQYPPAPRDFNLTLLDKPHPDGLLGFNVRGIMGAFEEACRRLDVSLIELHTAIPRRHRCGRVLRKEGTSCWLKVGGVYQTPNPYLERELSAFNNNFEQMPYLLDYLEWTDGTTLWVAFLMNCVEHPAVERLPFAGPCAAGVGDRWISDLKSALDRISALPVQSTVLTADKVNTVVRARFGAEAPFLADGQLVTAHGDVNWSNVTCPGLSVLDWELWGGAPPGYDIAYLLTFSALEPALLARLEQAFAAELATVPAAIRLYAIATMLHAVDDGWYPKSLNKPLHAMAARLLG